MQTENRVFIAQCDTYEQAQESVSRVLEAFGGAEAILEKASKGRGEESRKPKKIIVKPNLIMPKKPEDAATTHPAVIEAVCRAFVETGADVSIIDTTGAPHTKLTLKLLYGKTGMGCAAENSGAKLSYDTASRTEAIPNGRVIQKAELISPVLDADLVISVAKAKTHSFQTMTGCVKNMFGAVPGLGKPNLHRRFIKREDFAGMLIDVCRHIAPGFSILDGVWGMEGAGPTGGEPKHLRVIAGSFSPYAMDLAQCYLMGLRLDSVYTINEAAARGLAPADPEALTWLGDERESLRSNFKPAIARKDDAVPAIKGNCVLCGDCVRICPVQCIKLDGEATAIDGAKCIRCYCCHEFCPAKAIELG